MKKYIISAVAAIAISGSAVGYNLIATDHTHDKAVVGNSEIKDSHSGGTDAYGCHNNHKTGGYHCH